MKKTLITLISAICINFGCKDEGKATPQSYFDNARVTFQKYTNINNALTYSQKYQYKSDGQNEDFVFTDPFTLEYKKNVDGLYPNGSNKTWLKMNLDNQKRVISMTTRAVGFGGRCYLFNLTYNSEGYLSNIETKEAALNNNGDLNRNYVKVLERQLFWQNGNLVKAEAVRYDFGYDNIPKPFYSETITYSDFVENNTLSHRHFGLDYFGKGGVGKELLNVSGAGEGMMNFEYLFGGKQLPQKMIRKIVYLNTNSSNTNTYDYLYTFDDKGKTIEILVKYDGKENVRYNFEYLQ